LFNIQPKNYEIPTNEVNPNLFQMSLVHGYQITGEIETARYRTLITISWS
jgi:hypothetical protein